jgi:hypothetical protein
MDEGVAKAFSLGAKSTGLGPGQSRDNHTPFAFRPDRSRVRAVSDSAAVSSSVASGRPCIVVATFSSLAFGHARTLFLQMASNSANAIIFTTRASVGPESLAAQLLPAAVGATLPQTVTVAQSMVVPLAGAELAAWRAARADEAARAARAAAAVRERAREAEELAAATAAAAEAERAREAEAAAAAVAAAAAAAAATTSMDVDAAPVYLDDESEAIALIGDVDDCGGAVAVRRALRGGLAARFPMFARDSAAAGALAPTEYGLQVDPAFYVDDASAAAVGAGAAGVETSSGGVSAGGGGGGSSTGLPLQLVAAAAVATKTVRSVLTVRIAARVLLHALEGLATGSSLVHVLESIAPQRLVVLAGSAGVGADASLANARALAGAAVAARVAAADAVHVLSPGTGADALDVSSRVAEMTLRVFDAVTAGAAHALALEPALRRVGDHHRVASVATQVIALPSGDVFLAAADAPCSALGGDKGDGHLPVVLRAGGSLRISDLRKRLRGAGVACDVVDGAIVTRAGVIIRKRAGGGVHVEGPPVNELYAVRSVVAAAHVFF